MNFSTDAIVQINFPKYIYTHPVVMHNLLLLIAFAIVYGKVKMKLQFETII